MDLSYWKDRGSNHSGRFGARQDNMAACRKARASLLSLALEAPARRMDKLKDYLQLYREIDRLTREGASPSWPPAFYSTPGNRFVHELAGEHSRAEMF